VDDVHGALVYVVSSARRSIVATIYGFDDEELADLIKEKLESPLIYVQLTFDSSQAGGVHEKKLLAKEDYPLSSIAVGRSERGAIIHLKEAVVDGVVLVTGSTNWSTGGETLQDNELTIRMSPYEASQAAARMGAIHADCLQQMAKKKGEPHARRPKQATAEGHSDDKEA
jgi:hypothetical protein